MKKLILIMFSFMFLLCGCADNPPPKGESKASLIFSGKHELKAMGKINTEINSHSSGSFFFILGSYYSESKEIKTVSFAWKSGEEYIISTVPLDKIRIHIDNSIEKPYILFRWKADNYYYPKITTMIEEDVMYIVVFCKEEIWNHSISIPLSKQNE